MAQDVVASVEVTRRVADLMRGCAVPRKLCAFPHWASTALLSCAPLQRDLFAMPDDEKFRFRWGESNMSVTFASQRGAASRPASSMWQSSSSEESAMSFETIVTRNVVAGVKVTRRVADRIPVIRARGDCPCLSAQKCALLHIGLRPRFCSARRCSAINSWRVVTANSLSDAVSKQSPSRFASSVALHPD